MLHAANSIEAMRDVKKKHTPFLILLTALPPYHCGGGVWCARVCDGNMLHGMLLLLIAMAAAGRARLVVKFQVSHPMVR
jgi:hypothetical protein